MIRVSLDPDKASKILYSQISRFLQNLKMLNLSKMVHPYLLLLQITLTILKSIFFNFIEKGAYRDLISERVTVKFTL